jgi:hypothetical protein
MQNYLRRAAFGALNMNLLYGHLAAMPFILMIFAPCVPMVSLFLMIMNLSMMDQQQHPLARTKDSLLLTIMIHTIMETRVRIG